MKPTDQRLAPLLLLALSLGCTSAETTENVPAETRPGRATLEILAVWKQGKTDHLVGGLRCEVRRLEPEPVRGEQISEEGKPLRVEGIKPGTYTVTVSAKKRSYTTDEFTIEAGKKTTVRIDLLVAKEEADGSTLKKVGVGLFRVVTAPVRLTLKVLGASDTPKSGKPPFEVEEKPSSQ